MTCLAAFAAGIAVTIVGIGVLILGGLVIAAQVNDLMREIDGSGWQ